MNESQYINLQRKHWRALTYNWDVLADYSNVTSRLYCLTDFQCALLLSTTEYFRWQSRWIHSPYSQNELEALVASLDFNLMNCYQLQPAQLDFIYEHAITDTLAGYQALWDIDPNPSSINSNAPDDYFDGDGSIDRELALCTAIKIYVYSYAQNWVTKALVIVGGVAVLGFAASLTIVGGIIAAALLAGLGYMTSIALNAMQDSSALDEIICCMKSSLSGTVINQANFAAGLSACGFTPGSNAAIARDIIASDIGIFGNFLTFCDALGRAYELASYGVSDCVDCNTYIYRLNGNGNTNMAGITYLGVPTTYNATFDLYRGGYSGTGACNCYLQVEYDFGTPTLINGTTWTVNAHRTTGVGVNGISLLFDGVSKDFVDVPVTGSPVDYTLSWTGSETVTKIRILGGIHVLSPTNGGMDNTGVVISLP